MGKKGSGGGRKSSAGGGRYRAGISGRYVTSKYGKSHPKTTVRELK